MAEEGIKEIIRPRKWWLHIGTFLAGIVAAMLLAAFIYMPQWVYNKASSRAGMLFLVLGVGLFAMHSGHGIAFAMAVPAAVVSAASVYANDEHPVYVPTRGLTVCIQHKDGAPISARVLGCLSAPTDYEAVKFAMSALHDKADDAKFGEWGGDSLSGWTCSVSGVSVKEEK